MGKLRVSDIDSKCMLIRVEQGKGRTSSSDRQLEPRKVPRPSILPVQLSVAVSWPCCIQSTASWQTQRRGQQLLHFQLSC